MKVRSKESLEGNWGRLHYWLGAEKEIRKITRASSEIFCYLFFYAEYTLGRSNFFMECLSITTLSPSEEEKCVISLYGFIGQRKE